MSFHWFLIKKYVYLIAIIILKGHHLIIICYREKYIFVLKQKIRTFLMFIKIKQSSFIKNIKTNNAELKLFDFFTTTSNMLMAGVFDQDYYKMQGY